MRILITGSTGFIGRNLISRINNVKEYKLLLLVRNSNISIGKNISILNADLGYPESYIERVTNFQPEVLIHLAWGNIPDYSYDSSLTNHIDSIQLLNNIINTGSCKKIIVSGSCWEYSNRIGPLKEDDSTNAVDNFSWAKLSIQSWLNNKCSENHIEYAWLRLFYIYGPYQRDSSLLPSIIKNIINQTLPEIKTPLNCNDFIYIDDVTNAIVKILETNIESGIYNIGYGRSTPVLDLCKIVEKIILGTDKLFSDIEINEKSDHIDFWASNEKAKINFNWFPEVDLEKGICETYDYIKLNSNG